MAAPSPDLIVTNPPPLNPERRFPFRVDAFPAQWLLDFAGLGRAPAAEQSPAPNANRWED